MIRWLIVPIGILLMTPILAVAGLVDFGWFTLAYLIISLIALSTWRRATYKLGPSIATMPTVDEAIQRRIGQRLTAVFSISVVIHIVAALAFFVPTVRSSSIAMFLIAMTIVWTGISQFGFCNLICYRMNMSYEKRKLSPGLQNNKL